MCDMTHSYVRHGGGGRTPPPLDLRYYRAFSVKWISDRMQGFSSVHLSTGSCRRGGRRANLRRAEAAKDVTKVEHCIYFHILRGLCRAEAAEDVTQVEHFI